MTMMCQTIRRGSRLPRHHRSATRPRRIKRPGPRSMAVGYVRSEFFVLSLMEEPLVFHQVITEPGLLRGC